eukprot:CAMPEP_0194779044 /NCGR_PEP_ID=MMETSP0323_2-20130528/69960_1 /TAXON_ID=2866 ORGANISM="Crypthecodinium cohnii, Strain Seligo" /NCGR_SAMPLE_ID=MMETSP0323_2 /ASSEMBLY_ACC=CAM_ASM_000346 /LENGTH=42 /DNA_ID= /DNA_START= /DNA_END= /DNA_ORIENTATION=
MSENVPLAMEDLHEALVLGKVGHDPNLELGVVHAQEHVALFG